MNSPLIKELDRLIKMNLPKTMDNSGKHVEKVLLSEPFMKVSYLNEEGAGFAVDLIFDRFINKITLLEIRDINSEENNPEKQEDKQEEEEVIVTRDGTTVEKIDK